MDSVTKNRLWASWVQNSSSERELPALVTKKSASQGLILSQLLNTQITQRHEGLSTQILVQYGVFATFHTTCEERDMFSKNIKLGLLGDKEHLQRGEMS